MNRQLSVSDRPPFAALSSSIDSDFPSVCQLHFHLPLRSDTLLCVLSTALLPRSILCHLLCVDCLFSNCRCVQTPRHLLCVDRTFSTSQVLPSTSNLFVVPANPPFLLHLLCIDCAFSTSAALPFSFHFQLEDRHLGEVPRFSALLRFQRRYLIVQAKQRLLLH